MNWKNYLVAVLLCSMILALAFIHNSGSQTTFQYDPWADINDNGKIDAKDIGYTCRLFGTAGDPTKNVNVTNWMPPKPKTVLYATYSLTWGKVLCDQLVSGGGWLYVGDYQYITVYFEFTKTTFKGPGSPREWEEPFEIIPIATWRRDPSSSDVGYTDMILNAHKVVGVYVEPYGWGARAECGPATPYIIKAPYVKIEPMLYYAYWLADFNATATFNIYVYLHYNAPDNHKVWSGCRYRFYPTSRELIIEEFRTTEFRKLTISLQANVSCQVFIYTHDFTYDVINYSSGTLWRSYELLSTYVYVSIHPSITPYDIEFSIGLIP
jgi:hypothetical protein